MKYISEEKNNELGELERIIEHANKFEIGNRFLEARKRLGIPQAEVSINLGVSETTVRNWEKGEGISKMVTYALLEKLYDTTLDELLTGRKNEPEPTEKPLKK